MVDASITGLRPPSRQGNYLPHQHQPEEEEEEALKATEPTTETKAAATAAATAAAGSGGGGGDPSCSNNTVQTAKTEQTTDTEISATNTNNKVVLRRSHLRPRNRDVEERRRRSSESKHNRRQQNGGGGRKKERSIHRPRRSKSVDSASGLPGLRRKNSSNLNNSSSCHGAGGGRGRDLTTRSSHRPRRISIRQRTTGGISDTNNTNKAEEVTPVSRSSSSRRRSTLTSAEIDKAFDMLNVSESSFLPSRLGLRSPSGSPSRSPSSGTPSRSPSSGSPSSRSPPPPPKRENSSSRGRGTTVSKNSTRSSSNRSSTNSKHNKAEDKSPSPRRRTLPAGLTSVSPMSARGRKRKSKTSKSKGMSLSARQASSASDRLSSNNNKRRSSSNTTTRSRRKSTTSTSKTTTKSSSKTTTKKKKSNGEDGPLKMSQSERITSGSRVNSGGASGEKTTTTTNTNKKVIKKKKSNSGNTNTNSTSLSSSLISVRMSQSARLQVDDEYEWKEPIMERLSQSARLVDPDADADDPAVERRNLLLDELRLDKSNRSSRRGKRSSWAYGGDASFHLTTTTTTNNKVSDDDEAGEQQQLSKSESSLPSYQWELHNIKNNNKNNNKGLLDELRADKSTRTTRTDTPFPGSLHDRMSESAHEFGTTSSSDLKNHPHRGIINGDDLDDDDQRVIPKGSIRARSERISTNRSSSRTGGGAAGERSMRSSTRSNNLKDIQATTTIATSKRRVSKTKDRGDKAANTKRRSSHKPKSSKPMTTTRGESPPPLMLQPSPLSPPITPIPSATTPKRRRHTSPTPATKPFSELHKLQGGDDSLAMLSRSFRAMDDSSDDDEDDDGSVTRRRNSLFQLPVQLSLNKEDIGSSRRTRTTATEEESLTEESESSISGDDNDNRINDDEPPTAAEEVTAKSAPSANEEGCATSIHDNVTAAATAVDSQRRGKVTFDDHVVEHSGEDVTREWYSKECLAELINHEIQIVSRCGNQHEGSRGNYKSLHCCWRGLEHIQHQFDKMQHMQEHVQSVKMKYVTLMKSKQQESTTANAPGSVDVAEALRSHSRSETKEDRRRAIFLGQEDAKFVIHQIEFDRKCDAAHAADEERNNNNSTRGGVRSSLQRMSVMNPVATQYVSETIKDVTTNASFRVSTVVSDAVGGASKRVSTAVVGATTNTSKLVAATVVGPIREATASLRNVDSKLRGSCIKV